MSDLSKIPGATVSAAEAAAWPLSSRTISAADFLALWTPEEVQMCSADPDLNYAMLGAITQGTVNLDSPRLPQLLALAVEKGLPQVRAAQIAAGTPPAS